MQQGCCSKARPPEACDAVRAFFRERLHEEAERLRGLGATVEEHAQQVAESEARLRGLAPAEAEARGIKMEVEVLEDLDKPKAICAAAERFNADVVCIGGHTRPGFTAKSARRAYAVQTAGADRVAAFMNWKNNNLPAEAAAVLGECRRSPWFTRLPNWSISPVAGPASQLRGRLRGAPAKRRVGITGPADYRMLPRWRKPQRLRSTHQGGTK